MPQPRSRQVQGRLAIWECADHPRAPPDLAEDALQRIVRPDATPVLLREGVVAQRLVDPALHELGGLGQPLVAQLGDNPPSLLPRRFLDDGRIEVDTNTVERSIRPIALNRKNALFAGSDEGGANWAIIASLIETATQTTAI